MAMAETNNLDLKRRASDKRSLDIETMIAEENDPKQRAFLIVLNNINISLLANTESIKEIGIRLESHLTEYQEHVEAEDKIKNQGLGAWKIGAWVLGVAQIAIISAVGFLRADLADLHANMSNGQIVDAKVLERINALEHAVTTSNNLRNTP